MNVYDSMSRLYAFVFEHQEKNLKHRHISFMSWLIYNWHKRGCPEWFFSTRDDNMIGAGVTNKTYYYSVIKDLVTFGLISTRAGVNNNSPPWFRLDHFLEHDTNTFEQVRHIILNDEKFIRYLEKQNAWTREKVQKYITDFMENCEVTNDTSRNEVEYKKHIINKARKAVANEPVNVDDNKFDYLFKQ